MTIHELSDQLPCGAFIRTDARSVEIVGAADPSSIPVLELQRPLRKVAAPSRPGYLTFKMDPAGEVNGFPVDGDGGVLMYDLDEERLIVGLHDEFAWPEQHSEPERALRQLLSPMLGELGLSFHSYREYDPDNLSYLWQPSIALHLTDGSLSLGEVVRAANAVAKFLKTVSDRPDDQSVIWELVQGGFVEGLVGFDESDVLEAKARPYPTQRDRDKWELAKDVASFANSEFGGVVVIGLETRMTPSGDQIVRLVPFPASEVSAQQYRDVLADRIHPPVEGLEVRLINASDSQEDAFCAIRIPPQRSELRPFVVRGVVTEGTYLNHHISIPMRIGDNTNFADSSEIHSLLAAGRAALHR